MGRRIHVSNIVKWVHLYLIPLIWLIHREKFGIHNVDLNDPTRRRTPKGTASFLKKIYQDNGFVEE